MEKYTLWKTIAIRLSLLVALRRIYEKTEDPDDKPTRVVGNMVENYVRIRAKALDIDLSDVLEREEEAEAAVASK